MNVPLKAQVLCADGTCGQVTCVFISPLTRQLSHIVVAENSFPYLKRLVPLELVMTVTPTVIYLNCTGPQLSTLKPFLEIEHPQDGALYFTYPVDSYRTWPNGSTESMPVPAALERILPEELTIHRDSPVRAANGRFGRIKAFVVNPANKWITQVVIQRGFWWWHRSELTIPIAYVDHFAKDLVFLKVDKNYLQSLAVQVSSR